MIVPGLFKRKGIPLILLALNFFFQQVKFSLALKIFKNYPGLLQITFLWQRGYK